MRISDWSSDVCSSDLVGGRRGRVCDEQPDGALGNELPAEHEDSNAGEPSQPDRELPARRAALPGLAAVGERRDWHHCTQRRTMPEVYVTAMKMAMNIRRRAAAGLNS